ncbi:hypothetical protein LINGRAHAP2_LOCUS15905, partial [Linum grandiflorum]
HEEEEAPPWWLGNRGRELQQRQPLPCCRFRRKKPLASREAASAVVARGGRADGVQWVLGRREGRRSGRNRRRLNDGCGGGALMSSEKWKKSAFSSIREGKRIQGIVMDGRFWTNVHTCLCAAMPLVKILRLVDEDNQPTMPFLDLELNQAKEKIKSNFVNNERRYKPVLDIIEKRWTNQMSLPLHYAAYWLNPKVHFSQGFNESERKLKVGLYDCVERFSKNSEERLTIMEHLDAFHHAKAGKSYGNLVIFQSGVESYDSHVWYRNFASEYGFQSESCFHFG